MFNINSYNSIQNRFTNIVGKLTGKLTPEEAWTTLGKMDQGSQTFQVKNPSPAGKKAEESRRTFMGQERDNSHYTAAPLPPGSDSPYKAAPFRSKRVTSPLKTNYTGKTTLPEITEQKEFKKESKEIEKKLNQKNKEREIYLEEGLAFSYELGKDEFDPWTAVESTIEELVDDKKELLSQSYNMFTRFISTFEKIAGKDLRENKIDQVSLVKAKDGIRITFTTDDEDHQKKVIFFLKKVDDEIVRIVGPEGQADLIENETFWVGAFKKMT